jgi:serine/threonine protein kinase
MQDGQVYEASGALDEAARPTKKLKIRVSSPALSSASTSCPCDAEDRPDAYDPNTRTGRFHYTRQLGKGGHGVVFEALDMHAKRGSPLLVAVKVPRGYDSVDSAREELSRECSWSRLHLHTTGDERAQLFLKYLEDHTGPEHPIPYVVMELIDGEVSWTRLFSKGRATCSMADKSKVMRQLVQALTYLEHLELLHRDLRFHNIFLSPDLEVTVGDFGTMGRPDASFRFAYHNEGSWKKLDWIPFEARRLRDKNTSRCTKSRCYAFDVFSLGVIHLYMCLGQATTRKVLERVEQGRPPLDGDPSEELVLDTCVALRMVSKDPDERPGPGEILHSMQKTGLIGSSTGDAVQAGATSKLTRPSLPLDQEVTFKQKLKGNVEISEDQLESRDSSLGIGTETCQTQLDQPPSSCEREVNLKGYQAKAPECFEVLPGSDPSQLPLNSEEAGATSPEHDGASKRKRSDDLKGDGLEGPAQEPELKRTTFCQMRLGPKLSLLDPSAGSSHLRLGPKLTAKFPHLAQSRASN